MLSAARHAVASAAAVALALALAGCGSDEEQAGEKESASPSGSESSASPAPYLEVPEGVELTAPGTRLGLGDEGVIAWQPRQDRVATAGVTVERIERTSFRESFPGWSVDPTTAARTPYFVRLQVTNPGGADLAGASLPVWGADDGGTLEAPNYYKKSQLPVCYGAEALPASLDSDEPYELCQVYFIAPDRTLDSVAFRPPGDLGPITWSGEISKVQKPKKPKRAGRKKRG